MRAMVFWATLFVAGFSGMGAAVASDSAERSKQALKLVCSWSDSTLQNSTELSDNFSQQAVLFADAERKSIKIKLKEQLASRKFIKTAIFEAANLEGLMVEYLVVAHTQNQGMIYFRLRYVPYDDVMQLQSMNYNSSYEEIMKIQTLQPLQLKTC